MKLKYGRSELSFTIDQNKVNKVLKAAEKSGLEDPLASAYKAVKNPIESDSLLGLLNQKNPEDIVIIVNDVTRPTPYSIMLPPILDAIEEAGIAKDKVTFIVATGVHDRHSDEQNIEIFGEEIHNNYKFIHHDCDGELVDMGNLKSGNNFKVNKRVYDADFVITTGVILPHYFAGFSGGRKSILPGVAGRKTIENNHSRMVKLMGHLPPQKENPVSLEMIEAAEMIGVDFIINVVTNSDREVVKVTAGDLKAAWYEGIECSASMYHVPLEEKADVSIVSSGGFPRDINVYQSQKALDHADHGTKKGGTIIWVAECSEGLGENTFETWMEEAEMPEDNVRRIKEKFVIGGHKAFAISKVATDKEVILISSLNKELTEKMFLKKMDTLQDAVDYVEKKYNGDYSSVILPQGSLTVPVVSSN
jgi:nickel-dependent lactate racemase